MSVELVSVFTGTHPRLVNKLGAVTGLEKPGSGPDFSAVAKSAMQDSRAQISGKAKETLSPIDPKSLDKLQPQLSRQAPTSSIENTQRPELATNNSVFISRQVIQKSGSSKPASSALPASDKKDDVKEEEEVRNVGYFISFTEDSIPVQEKSERELPYPKPKANKYRPPESKIGALVNITA